MVKIMVVEDQHIVRIGFVGLLNTVPDFEVVAEANNGEDAVKLAKEKQPDIVLMDLDLPVMDGIKATKRILAQNRNISVLALTGYVAEPFPTNFLQAGGRGYVTKDVSLAKLSEAIRTVMSNNVYLMPTVADRLAFQGLPGANKPLSALLSNREREVMVMVTKGMDIKSIAKTLSVTSKTINTYRYRIYDKLRVKGDVQMALAGIRHGIVRQTLGVVADALQGTELSLKTATTPETETV